MEALFIPHRFRAEIIEDEAVMLLEDEDFVVLPGVPVVRIFQCLLGGICRYEDIVHRLQPEIPMKKVRDHLEQLVHDGFLDECLPSLMPGLKDVSSALEVPARRVLAAFKDRVAIEGYGFDLTPFRAVLEELGVQVGTPASRTVVLADYLDPQLEDFNRRALETGHSWMLVKPCETPYIGPIFVPGRTPCFHCFAERYWQNRPAARFLTRKIGRSPLLSDRNAPSALRAIALRIAAWELVRWMVMIKHDQLEGQLMRLDTSTWQPTWHRVARLPRCPACSVHDVDTPPKSCGLVLQSRKKKDTNGDRVLAPEEAVAVIEPLVDPLTGPFRDLRRLNTLAGGPFETFVVRHPLILVIDSLQKLRLNEEAGGSSGKGKTETQARARALLEAAERYSTVWRGNEVVVRSSYKDLKPAALHLSELLGFSSRQYANRAAWNTSCPSIALRVPEPFDEDERIDWVLVHSLDGKTIRYLPAAFAYFGYPVAGPPFCYADSNGNAAGSNLEEAILSGFCEVAERNSVALWWFNRIRRPSVDLGSFKDSYFKELRAFFRDVLRRDLWALDVTSELGIPSFVAVSRRTDQKPEEVVMGFGCCLDPGIALRRALAEVSQILHGLVENASDGTSHVQDPLMRAWLQTVTVDQHPYLAPDPNQPAKKATDYPCLCSDDLLEDIHTCARRAASCGIDVYVLDLTREDVGLPVVKVIVPGLVHYFRRLGFRRLYDVPVKMGWLARAHTEEEMNPRSIEI